MMTEMLSTHKIKNSVRLENSKNEMLSKMYTQFMSDQNAQLSLYIII